MGAQNYDINSNNKKKVYTATDLWENSTKPQIGTSTERLLKFRLVWYSVCFLHLAIVALVLIQIDYDAYDDKIKVYKYFRFRLLTIWLNILHILYNPLGFYCDWQEKQGRHLEGINKYINKFRHFLMNAIILPITCTMDTFFWSTWVRNRELLVPSYCDVIIPYWCQHSLHTFSFIFMVVELLAVPRSKPATLKYHFAALYVFIGLYILVIFETKLSSGLWLYPFLSTFNAFQMIIFFAYIAVDFAAYFMLQWCIVDIVWGQQLVKTEKHMKSN